MATPEQLAPVQSAAALDFYTGTFSGAAPVRIRMHLNVVERLGRAVRLAFESDPSHTSEIGGLLLGTADFRLSRVVEVQDFEPLLCEYRTDHMFILSDSDRMVLEQKLAARSLKRDRQLVVVGYYQSHSGEHLSLRREDLSTVHSYFCDPAHVVLLIKRTPDHSSSAGFFLWDNGRIESEFSFLEFPFEVQQLKCAKADSSRPRASSRPTADARVDQSLRPEFSSRADASVVEERLTGIKKQIARVLRRRLSPLTATLLVAVGLVAFAAYIRWAARETSAPEMSETSVLGLRVERRENGLRLKWGRNAPGLNRAKEAVLSIRDGGEVQLQSLRLELDQLRNGSVLYTPTHSRVQFWLEVTADDGRKVSETVLVLTAAKPDVAHANSSSTPENMQRRTKRPAAAQPASAKSHTARHVEIPPPRYRKALTPPGARYDFGGPVWVMAADPPPLTWRRTQASTLLEQLVVSQPRLAPPPIALRQNASAGENATPVSGATPERLPSYVAARPIHEERPQLSPDIRKMVTSEIAVQVRLQIDGSGRVVRAAPVASTGPMTSSLVNATQDAARRWKFMPAMRGNQPVASEVVLEFRYRPTGAN